jgi:hypothetical protein
VVAIASNRHRRRWVLQAGPATLSLLLQLELHQRANRRILGNGQDECRFQSVGGEACLG